MPLPPQPTITVYTGTLATSDTLTRDQVQQLVDLYHIVSENLTYGDMRNNERHRKIWEAMDAVGVTV